MKKLITTIVLLSLMVGLLMAGTSVFDKIKGNSTDRQTWVENKEKAQKALAEKMLGKKLLIPQKSPSRAIVPTPWFEGFERPGGFNQVYQYFLGLWTGGVVTAGPSQEAVMAQLTFFGGGAGYHSEYCIEFGVSPSVGEIFLFAHEVGPVSANQVLMFDYYIFDSYNSWNGDDADLENAVFTVSICTGTTDTSPTIVKTFNKATFTDPKGWDSVSFEIPEKYYGTSEAPQPIRVKFHGIDNTGTTSYNKKFMRIDNVYVGDPVTKNLEAISVDGTPFMAVNSEKEFTLKIANVGMTDVAAAAYKVQLKQLVYDVDNTTGEPITYIKDRILIGETDGKAIVKGATADFKIKYKPTKADTVDIVAVIDYAEDQLQQNNESIPRTVRVLDVQDVVTIGDMSLTNGSSVQPFAYWLESGISQVLYKESDIGVKDGLITSVAYLAYVEERKIADPDNAGEFLYVLPTDTRVVLYMAVTENDIMSENQWIPANQFVKVFDGNLEFPEAGLYEIVVNLDTPFAYQGGNIVIMGYRPIEAQNEYYDIWWYGEVLSYDCTLARTTNYGVPGIPDPMTSLPGIAQTSKVRPHTYLIMKDDTGFGKINGTVMDDASTPKEIGGVSIAWDSTPPRYVKSGTDGKYSFKFLQVDAAKEITFTASKVGFTGETKKTKIESTTPITWDFTMNAIPSYTVTGKVQDHNGGSLADVSVRLSGYDNVSTASESSGDFSLKGVYKDQIYTLTVSKLGYKTYVDNAFSVSAAGELPTPIKLTAVNELFSYGFESANIPNSWTIIDNDNDKMGEYTFEWYTLFNESGNVYAHTGKGVAYSESFASDGISWEKALKPDNWLITPQINIKEEMKEIRLTWWIATVDPDYPKEEYSVYVSKGKPEIADFGTTAIFHETLSEKNTTWEERSVKLDDSFIGEKIYIAFRHHTDEPGGMFIILLDDVLVTYEGDKLDSSDITIPPVVTSLNGNYPNPFNPVTTISFNVAKESKVSIDVFNIKGQKVKTLTNDIYKPGAHKVEWNGKDSGNKNVSSGVYFYRMKAEGFNETKKMILLK